MIVLTTQDQHLRAMLQPRHVTHNLLVTDGGSTATVQRCPKGAACAEEVTAGELDIDKAASTAQPTHLNGTNCLITVDINPAGTDPF